MALVDAFYDDFATEETNDVNELTQLEEVGDSDAMDFINEYSLDRSVSHIARLKDSDTLQDIIKRIGEFQSKSINYKDCGTIETNPEYQLIVQSNDLIIEIDNEINIIHKYVKDIYASRYPELATVVTDSIEYLRTVGVFGNNIKDIAQHKNALSEFIASATIMVISITAASSVGTELSESRLANVNEACQMALDLHGYKNFILKFVESRMPIFAPNLSAILGSNVAAKLIGHAGSLRALAFAPGCNIANYGSARKNDSGVVAMQNSQRSCGFIFFSEQVQRLPMDLRKKASKLYANKAALAARIDLSHNFPSGEKGVELMQVIQKSIDKWQEPPPVKATKALPAPIDMPSKKRGGRRHRKMKERLGMTELRRSANRMEFGSIEEAYKNELSEGAGQLGRGARVRVALPDVRTRAKASKSLNQKLTRQHQLLGGGGGLHGVGNWGGATSVRRQVGGGATTTVAFTPLRGVEISNPAPPESKIESGLKYF